MARYIDPTDLAQPPPADPDTELLSSLNKILRGYLPQKHYSRHDLHGLYSGPTSIALVFERLSRSKPDFSLAGKTAKQWSLAYLEHDLPEAYVGPDRCGIANETLATLAVSALHTHDEKPIKHFLTYIPLITRASARPDHPASNEWLYGRAGTLYLLRLIRTAASNVSPAIVAEIDAAIEDIIAVIVAQGPDWKWHGKQYLGAAHGAVGVLTQCLLSSGKARGRREELWGWLRGLLECQLGSGNFPSSGGKERDELVQFCHGAPGVVVSLMALFEYVPNEDDHGALIEAVKVRETMSKVVERARIDISKRGLLVKEPCLCHGVSGNALALVGKEREALMQWAQEGVRRQWVYDRIYIRGDDPWGLYCGEAGRAWSWMVMLGLGRGLLGFTDL